MSIVISTWTRRFRGVLAGLPHTTKKRFQTGHPENGGSWWGLYFFNSPTPKDRSSRPLSLSGLPLTSPPKASGWESRDRRRLGAVHLFGIEPKTPKHDGLEYMPPALDFHGKHG